MPILAYSRSLRLNSVPFSFSIAASYSTLAVNLQLLYSHCCCCCCCALAHLRFFFFFAFALNYVLSLTIRLYSNSTLCKYEEATSLPLLSRSLLFSSRLQICKAVERIEKSQFYISLSELLLWASLSLPLLLLFVHCCQAIDGHAFFSLSLGDAVASEFLVLFFCCCFFLKAVLFFLFIHFFFRRTNSSRARVENNKLLSDFQERERRKRVALCAGRKNIYHYFRLCISFAKCVYESCTCSHMPIVDYMCATV